MAMYTLLLNKFVWPSCRLDYTSSWIVAIENSFRHRSVKDTNRQGPAKGVLPALRSKAGLSSSR